MKRKRLSLSIQESKEIFAAAAEPKELWIVEGAKHTDLHAESKVEYEQRVLSFFSESTCRSARCAMITRDDLQNMFDSARANAKWSIDDVCLWGYFFTDQDRNKLSSAALVLESMGYRVVDLYEAEANCLFTRPRTGQGFVQ
jgi:hypothetical protein